MPDLVPDLPPDDIAREKALARVTLLQARSERSREPYEDERRTDALLRLTEGAETVAAYVSYGTEPSTAGALAAWLARGTRVLLPVVLPDRDLEFRVYDGSLVTGRLGITCPPPSCPVAEVSEASVVLVPALACDRAGRRLGRGGGSYDRVLPRVRPDALTVALVYPEELWASVPVEAHDQHVRAVIAGDELVRVR